jgi:hypothetical protein
LLVREKAIRASAVGLVGVRVYGEEFRFATQRAINKDEKFRRQTEQPRFISVDVDWL